MQKREFEAHHFTKDEEVMYQGKPTRVVSYTNRYVVLKVDGGYKTVLAAEIELIDGANGVEFR